MSNFPALTIKQPWASLIMLGVKDIENRSWTTGYRGPLWVHAGKAWADDEWPDDPALRFFDFSHFTRESIHVPRGSLLGTVDLCNIITDSESPWAIKGQNHWVIRNPRSLFKPLPWRGQTGLWRPFREA